MPPRNDPLLPTLAKNDWFRSDRRLVYYIGQPDDGELYGLKTAPQDMMNLCHQATIRPKKTALQLKRLNRLAVPPLLQCWTGPSIIIGAGPVTVIIVCLAEKM